LGEPLQACAPVAGCGKSGRAGKASDRWADVLRRFERGWMHFVKIYRPRAAEWPVYEVKGYRI
jgi:hypothetical protein